MSPQSHLHPPKPIPSPGQTPQPLQQWGRTIPLLREPSPPTLTLQELGEQHRPPQHHKQCPPFPGRDLWPGTLVLLHYQINPQLCPSGTEQLQHSPSLCPGGICCPVPCTACSRDSLGSIYTPQISPKASLPLQYSQLEGIRMTSCLPVCVSIQPLLIYLSIDLFIYPSVDLAIY